MGGVCASGFRAGFFAASRGFRGSGVCRALVFRVGGCRVQGSGVQGSGLRGFRV